MRLSKVNATLRKNLMWLEIFVFFVVAALLYLLLAKEFGYYNDDWYSMYAARVAGPDVFYSMFSVDRPGRSYLMAPLYAVFKGNPFPYSISAYLIRVSGAYSLLWLLRLLWPKDKSKTFIIALLFLIFPGFLDQPIAIDFQSHQVGILFAFVSLGLMVKFLTIKGVLLRRALWLGSFLTGWLYLSQMEYYIGFEAVRVLIIALFLWRNDYSWLKKISATVKEWIPFSIIPVSFLFWRLAIFSNERVVTDFGTQLGEFTSNPLYTGANWLAYFLHDIINVMILAWVVPFNHLSKSLRLRDDLIAGGLAILVIGIIYFFWYQFSHIDEEINTPQTIVFAKEGFWLGFGWVIVGLLPVILMNRHITYPDYSRYGIVSATGGIILLISIWTHISGENLRLIVISALFASATVTHYANSVVHADSSDVLREFWWQVSWRVPQFDLGTTLVAHYPKYGVREPLFVWGPANQIYYPFRLEENSVQTGIHAILLDNTSAIDILYTPTRRLDKYRSVDTYPNSADILILTQPSEHSCVQVLNGSAPEYSPFETTPFLLIGPKSNPEHIILDEDFKTPPEFLFGSEPEHTWCYFYQKATFARQKGDWNEVLLIGKEVDEQGYRPGDLIEWMPFLQAYALAGDTKQLQKFSSIIWSDKYVAIQACQILKELQGLDNDVKDIIDLKYCKVKAQ